MRSPEPAERLAEALGGMEDLGLLEQALVHRSYSYENGLVPTNERLEFLGDSVLGLVVTEELYRRFPDLPEGQLAKLRSAVVNSGALATVARELGLGDFLQLGRGEDTSGGRDKSSILADAVEAILGAVYLDRGMPAAEALVHRLFDPLIDRAADLGAGLDWKTSLQELTARCGLGAPEYAVDEDGPDHAKHFAATVVVDGQARSRGEGRSKKEAEQRAAALAFAAIERENGLEPDSRDRA